MRDQIHIITGGTYYDIRPHFSFAARARGSIGRELTRIITQDFDFEGEVHLYETQMAGGDYTVYSEPEIDEDSGAKTWQTRRERSGLATVADVAELVAAIVENPRVRILMMPVAMVDFEADMSLGGVTMPVGAEHPRLRSTAPLKLDLKPATKIIASVRETRKDLFLVGFKSTTHCMHDEQFDAGLRLLKQAHCNLVLATDLTFHRRMIITPEQTRYEGDELLTSLVNMALRRSEGTFTRSTVVPGETVGWTSSPLVPPTLKTVVDHCIARGAYKPFQGATVGHFAARIPGVPNKFVTSKRRVNFNQLDDVGLVMIEADPTEDRVTAYGARPSVGGQSQRIIFEEHEDVDCIVHFHCPPKAKPAFVDGEFVAGDITVQPQWQYECGSHECGKNTSDGLHLHDLGDGHKLYAVYLDNHGPNIAFHRDTDPAKVIAFIEEHFDLTRSTQGKLEDLA